jgi:site-specific DNA-cytosine methylase
MQTVSWFVKVIRSGARYEDGSLPAEVWREYEVCPTLNAFDNGDSRATTIIFYGNRVADIRLQDNKINTLQARMGTGGNNMPMVATDQVRRLMPLECERLQGFPDGWTDGQSDTNRYKQMGNAVAVPVVEWIIQGICDTI